MVAMDATVNPVKRCILCLKEIHKRFDRSWTRYKAFKYCSQKCANKALAIRRNFKKPPVQKVLTYKDYLKLNKGQL